MTISEKVVPAACTPIKSLTWDAIMSIATADVYPAFTGPEIKSIKNPAAPSRINTVIAIKFVSGALIFQRSLVNKSNIVFGSSLRLDKTKCDGRFAFNDLDVIIKSIRF